MQMPTTIPQKNTAISSKLSMVEREGYVFKGSAIKPTYDCSRMYINECCVHQVDVQYKLVVDQGSWQAHGWCIMAPGWIAFALPIIIWIWWHRLVVIFSIIPLFEILQIFHIISSSAWNMWVRNIKNKRLKICQEFGQKDDYGNKKWGLMIWLSSKSWEGWESWVGST